MTHQAAKTTVEMAGMSHKFILSQHTNMFLKSIDIRLPTLSTKAVCTGLSTFHTICTSPKAMRANPKFKASFKFISADIKPSIKLVFMDDKVIDFPDASYFTTYFLAYVVFQRTRYLKYFRRETEDETFIDEDDEDENTRKERAEELAASRGKGQKGGKKK